MDIITTITENGGAILNALLGVFAVASLFIAGTKTPDPDTTFGKVYRVIEALALNVGRAKETGKRDVGPSR